MEPRINQPAKFEFSKFSYASYLPVFALFFFLHKWGMVGLEAPEPGIPSPINFVNVVGYLASLRPIFLALQLWNGMNHGYFLVIVWFQ